MTSAADAHAAGHIVVRGAREHNLREVDVEIPRERLVVITGLSGSGKSSLAFDTLYAEGQRRYVESLSAYARQFLDQMAKPDVESIEGLSPAISIEQRTVSKNPRSTVGTITEILDYLRLLYARAGQPHCWTCGRPIASQSVQQMAQQVLAIGEGARVDILAPIVRGRKGVYKKEFAELRQKGFVRARVDGAMRELAEEIKLDRQKPHDIEVVVDRVAVKESARGRIVESLTTALGLASGLATLLWSEAGAAKELILSEANACVACGVSFPELAPRMFSFNSPAGACPRCDGLGSALVVDAEKLVPDAELSLAKGAIAAWGDRRPSAYYRRLLEDLAGELGFALETPWRELPEKTRRQLLHGAGAREFALRVGARGDERVRRAFDGVLGDLDRRCEANGALPDELARFAKPAPCSACGGARIDRPARSVKLGGLALHELVELPLGEVRAFLDALALSQMQRAVAERVLEEIRERLGFLTDVGLDYLSLARSAASLSGGEAQRIRLATQVGSHLLGVLYILDEPSVGLHARDNERLLASLEKLRDAGNSVIVVEHDEATIRRADHVIDMGPGAGVHGGTIVAHGAPAAILACEASLTGAYLSGRRAIAVPARRPIAAAKRLVLEGCREHNLRSLRVELPLGRFVVVTGVSGSGKSTLISDTLHPALARRLHAAERVPGRFDRLLGAELLDKVIEIDQAPIGRTPRSNPVTYTGAFDGIRKLFSQVPEARMRGYEPGRFSFNVKGGRCESCQGDGLLHVEMHFLPDLYVSCEVCRGRRYNRETLEIRWKGRSIADVLELSVAESVAFFEHQPSLARPLATLDGVGLGYLQLGQPATTLSGGEAQRVKLARELARRDTGKTLYLLDEPTTGLHFADVENLLRVLHQLVERGNTVVVIEHHLDVIKSADWVIDLGPEGGKAGGEIVVVGTPEEVARCAASHTGRALAAVLA